MITIQDFTLLPEGPSLGFDGPVVTCPCCGRHGVLEAEAQRTLCVHSETTAVLADGMLIEPTDCCVLQRLR
jgi:hypothetical protein